MIEVERIWLGAYASLLGDVALQELCFGGIMISEEPHQNISKTLNQIYL